MDLGKILQIGKDNKLFDLKSSRFINSWSPNIQTFNRFNEFAQSTSVTKVVKGGFSLANIPIIGGHLASALRKSIKRYLIL